jgi:hypothetical protein
MCAVGVIIAATRLVRELARRGGVRPIWRGSQGSVPRPSRRHGRSVRGAIDREANCRSSGLVTTRRRRRCPPCWKTRSAHGRDCRQGCRRSADGSDQIISLHPCPPLRRPCARRRRRPARERCQPVRGGRAWLGGGDEDALAGVPGQLQGLIGQGEGADQRVA